MAKTVLNEPEQVAAVAAALATAGLDLNDPKGEIASWPALIRAILKSGGRGAGREEPEPVSAPTAGLVLSLTELTGEDALHGVLEALNAIGFAVDPARRVESYLDLIDIVKYAGKDSEDREVEHLDRNAAGVALSFGRANELDDIAPVMRRLCPAWRPPYRPGQRGA